MERDLLNKRKRSFRGQDEEFDGVRKLRVRTQQAETETDESGMR